MFKMFKILRKLPQPSPLPRSLSPLSGDCSLAQASRESRTRPTARSPSSPPLLSVRRLTEGDTFPTAILFATTGTGRGVCAGHSQQPLPRPPSFMMAPTLLSPFLHQQLRQPPPPLRQPSNLGCQLRCSQSCWVLVDASRAHRPPCEAGTVVRGRTRCIPHSCWALPGARDHPPCRAGLTTT